jgi:hypothetical protein
METNMQTLNDSEMPLEENFYDRNGQNICKAKELSFMKIDFYNVKPAQKDFILEVLRMADFDATNPRKYSENLNSVIIIL